MYFKANRVRRPPARARPLVVVGSYYCLLATVVVLARSYPRLPSLARLVVVATSIIMVRTVTHDARLQ